MIFITLGVMAKAFGVAALHDARRVPIRWKWSRNNFSGIPLRRQGHNFGRTDPRFIDDSALNFVGLDSSDAVVPTMP